MAIAAYIAFEPADEEAALSIGAELERNGWSITRSGPDLRAQEKLAALVQAIGETQVVIVLASPAAEQSAWLQREVAAALNNGRPVIVVLTDAVSAESWIHATLDTASAIDFQSGARSE